MIPGWVLGSFLGGGRGELEALNHNTKSIIFTYTPRGLLGTWVHGLKKGPWVPVVPMDPHGPSGRLLDSSGINQRAAFRRTLIYVSTTSFNPDRPWNFVLEGHNSIPLVRGISMREISNCIGTLQRTPQQRGMTVAVGAMGLFQA